MAKRRRILAIGLDERRHVICERHGIDVVTVCSFAEIDQEHPGDSVATELLRVDQHIDPGCVVAELRRSGWSGNDFDRIVTSDEFAVPTASAIASALGIPGMPLTSAVAFRDKHLQKHILREAGLPVPQTRLIDDIKELGELPAWSSWPAVVKPVAGAGAGSTARCDSLDDLGAFAAGRQAGELRSFFGSPERKFVLESFSEGVEWHIDGCVADGEILTISVGHYPVPPLAITNAGVFRHHHFDPVRDSSTFDQARDFAHRALAALGLRDGIFHMECFNRDGELVFGECAARIHGAMLRESAMAKLGMDLLEWEALLAVGEEPPARSGAYANLEVGGTSLAAPPGILLKAPLAQQILERPGVVYATEPPPTGATMLDMSANSAIYFAEVVLAAPTFDEVSSHADAVIAWTKEQTVVASPQMTRRELWQLAARPTRDSA